MPCLIFYFGHAWCIYILPSSCFNLQIQSIKKKREKKYHAIESNWGKNRKACGNSSEDESKIGKKRERETKIQKYLTIIHRIC